MEMIGHKVPQPISGPSSLHIKGFYTSNGTLVASLSKTPYAPPPAVAHMVMSRDVSALKMAGKLGASHASLILSDNKVCEWASRASGRAIDFLRACHRVLFSNAELNDSCR